MASIPYEDNNSSPDVWRHDFPHNTQELEYNIWNIEYCEQPVVTIPNQIEILAHAGDTGVPITFTLEHSPAYASLGQTHTQHLTDQEMRGDLTKIVSCMW